MPHISKNRLNQQVFNKVMFQFAETFKEADSRSNTVFVVNELFTKTEKIMFAKRIAIIYLLDKNVSFEKISNTLRISHTTISKYSLALEQGKYKQLMMVITKKGKLLDSLEKLLQMGLPPIRKGRWKNI